MLRGVCSDRISAALSVFFVLAIIILPVVRAHAQVTGATLSGTVTDVSGAVIPGVQVSIKNRATGVVRDVTADETGFYTAPNLLAGNYDVTVSNPGFTTVVQSNIALAVGAQPRLNLLMTGWQKGPVVEVAAGAAVG